MDYDHYYESKSRQPYINWRTLMPRYLGAMTIILMLGMVMIRLPLMKNTKG
jgi:hypothetical protein